MTAAPLVRTTVTWVNADSLTQTEFNYFSATHDRFADAAVAANDEREIAERSAHEDYILACNAGLAQIVDITRAPALVSGEVV